LIDDNYDPVLNVFMCSIYFSNHDNTERHEEITALNRKRVRYIVYNILNFIWIYSYVTYFCFCSSVRCKLVTADILRVNKIKH